MSENGGTVRACASCKFQRKRCKKECFLAPYFPVNRSQDFKNVHKLFGVSNITKILNSLKADQRSIAAQTIIVEAKARNDDPVNGCVGIINKLYSQLELNCNELDIVNQELFYARQRVELHQQQQQGLQCFLASSPSSSSCFLASSPSSSSSLLFLQQFGNCHALDLGNETYNTGEMKNLGQGYNYCSSFQEFEDLNKTYDVKLNDQTADTYHHQNAIMNCNDSADTHHHQNAIMNCNDSRELSGGSTLIEKQSQNHVPDEDLKNVVGIFNYLEEVHGQLTWE